MAFLPGIFGPKLAETQPQQQQPNNQQQNPSQQQNPGNNNGSGGGAQQQSERAANQQMDTSNPLDPFMALMTPSKEVLESKANKTKAQNSGLFGDNFTPENIQKSVGSVNFAQNLDPAKVQAALGGDANAFMEVLNSAVQSGVSASVQMSHGMVEKGVATGQERFSGDLDSRFRDFTLRGQNVDNPALKHPVGKALLSTVAKQIAEANPRMPADEVHKQATAMFGEFSKLMAAPSQEQEKASSKGGMDWMNFVDEAQT
jgi:hypothetical protein